MNSQTKPSGGRVELSRGFLRTRREAAAILALWAVCLIWCVGYSTTFGFAGNADAVEITWGMPHWIVWGVFLPWLVATVASIIFSLFAMADEDDELDSELSSTGEDNEVPNA